MEEKSIDYKKMKDFPQRFNTTCHSLNLTPKNICDEDKLNKSVKSILGSLSTIASGINDLRNDHGTGHGKIVSYESLTPRYARLAVGTAMVAAKFIWESYQEQKDAQE